MGAEGGSQSQKQSGDPPTSYGRPHKLKKLIRSVFSGRWPVWLVAAATFINGLLNILLTLVIHFPQNPRLFNILAPFGLYHFNRSLTITVGFILIYLSFNLFQRRKIAWWLATIGCFISLVSTAVDSQLWPTVIVPSITLILLLAFRRRFSVRSGWHNVERGLILAGITLLIAICYGIAGFLLLNQGDFQLNFSILEALVRTLRELTLVGNNDLAPQTDYAAWFLTSLRIIGLVAFSFVIYSLFRPVAYRLVFRPSETSTARNILRKYGHASYDYFKIWNDKSYFFSETRESFLSYRVEWNIAVCLGDPMGPDSELETILVRFRRYCHDNGWGLVLLLPENLALYPKIGLHLLKIGEEGIVDLRHFKEVTSQKKYFRHISRKFTSLGYSAVRYKPPHSSALVDEIEHISREWLALPGHREFGFAQGVFDRSYVAQSPLYVIRDNLRRAVAFVNEVPSYRSGEAIFDMMRHVPEVPNGTMDYIFQGLMLALEAEGYKTFAMGVAPLAGVGDGPGSSVIARALHQLKNHNWFARYKGLRQYKLKFEPYWEDRFLAYQGGKLALVKIALAILRAMEKGSPSAQPQQLHSQPDFERHLR